MTHKKISTKEDKIVEDARSAQARDEARTFCIDILLRDKGFPNHKSARQYWRGIFEDTFLQLYKPHIAPKHIYQEVMKRVYAE